MTIIQTILGDSAIRQPSRGLAMAAVVALPVPTGGSTSSADYYGAVKTTTTGATNHFNYQLSPSFGVELENLTPGIASLSEDGLLTRIADGVAKVTATGDYKSVLYLPVTQSGGQSVAVFDGWADDSASKSVSDELEALWTEGGTLPLFTTKNDSAGTYVKDADCWAADVDLTGLSVALSLDGGITWSQAGAPVAVTRRHGAVVAHWGHDYSNAVARFRGADGTLHERGIIGASIVIAGEDLRVVTFGGADLPASVTPFKIVGEWFREAMTLVTSHIYECWCGAYGFAVNQNYEAVGMFIGRGTELSRTYRNTAPESGTYYSGIEMCGKPNALALAGGHLDSYDEFFKLIIQGDSGKPTFILIDGEACLLAIFTTAHSGPFIGALDGDIANEMIASADADGSVSTGKTVTLATSPV